MATIDPLTLLFNRRKFNELLDYEIEMEKCYQIGLSIIFCDIDNFKKVNDTYGHDIGDNVLSAFALQIKSPLRETDSVARWGGEEFIILMPKIRANVAVIVAEKIRENVEGYDFIKVGKVTASFGVTDLHGGDDRDVILKRVDEALYMAKKKWA